MERWDLEKGKEDIPEPMEKHHKINKNKIIGIKNLRSSIVYF